MTPTEHSSKTPHSTGGFAVLRARVPFGGSSAISYNTSTCRPIFLVGLAIVVCALIVAHTTPAFASTEHGEHTTGTPFGKEGSGPGEFAGLAGVANNETTGDVYVVDSGNNRVEYFSATGKFEGEFHGASAAGTGTLEEGSSTIMEAAANTGAFTAGEEITGPGIPAGTTITNVPAAGVLEISNPVEAGKSGMLVPLTAHQSFSGPQGIAVDNDPSSPSYQDVYVADPGMSAIDKFGPTGEYKGQITGADGGSLEDIEGIAVDPSGVLWVDHFDEETGEPRERSEINSYSGEEPNAFTSGQSLSFGSEQPGFAVVSEQNSEGNLEDEFYVAIGARIEKLNGEGKVLVKEFCSQRASGLAVESSSKDLYVDTGSVVVRCSPAGKVIETLSATGSGKKGTVAVNSSNGYVYATNAEALAVDVFPPVAGAGIREEQASSVEASGATLEALIDPNAYDHTTYHFEYDITPYTSSANHGESTPDVEVPTGTSPVTISGRAKLLHAGTAYYYRVVVESEVEGKTVTVDGPSASFTTPAAPGSAPPQNCANEQRRAEQPFGLKLPDCRAYEMVSPVETEGQNATEEGKAQTARAAEEGAPAQPMADVPQRDEGGAVTYATAGAFAGTSAEPPGAGEDNQYVSRREPARGGWSTQAISPLHEPDEAETEGGGPYATDAFDPQLTEGIAKTNAPLTPEAPKTVKSGAERGLGLYVADFAGGSYRYITTENYALPLGVSSDLSHVVFGGNAPRRGEIYEWFKGTTVPVSVTNNKGEDSQGEEMGNAGVAGWHGVSADGSRVFLTSEGQLYARVNAEQKQSPIVSPEASGNGTVEAGSNEVSSLSLASGIAALSAETGSTEIIVRTQSGRFVVGQHISGSSLETGTFIEHISVKDLETHTVEGLTLSAPTISQTEINETTISSPGPEPFEVGQKITGNGIPSGTTITEAVAGKLTLSEPATSSVNGEALHAGGGCTVTADACTVEVSSAGATGARYWGASADGTKVFFTKEGNLYQYELPIGSLTGTTTAIAEGAEVQGVVQISEDGSYVYFVAGGVLASGAKPETCEAPNEQGEGGTSCNLYVIHDGGSPRFIAALGADDRAVWDGSPETNTAVVSPGGSYLAFLSKASLTGYDNEQAKPGDCEGTTRKFNEGENGKCREAYLYDAETRKLVCASCNPTGARPLGPANLGEPRNAGLLYRPRVVTNEGTLFFDSYDALVPHASDGLQNVYEYEDGQIHAISNVAGGFPSFLLDTSASGGDVFFGTSDKLLPEDASNNVVVYDARIDGGFPVTVTAPPCATAEACRTASPPTPTVFGAPPSATFSGPGNVTPPSSAVVKPKILTRAQKLAAALKVCRKDKKKSKRQTCEKQARDKYGPVKKKAKAKKSSNDRRASR